MTIGTEESLEERRAGAEAATLRSPSARIVHAAILQEGEEELDRTWQALAWSGLAAGFSMGLSLAVEGVLTSRLPEAEWAPLVAKLGYPIGFLAVVLGRQQLFTENTLTAVLPFFHDRSLVWKMLRLWGIVLLANLIGVFVFAWLAARTSTFSPEAREAFAEIGRLAMRNTFTADLVKGVFGGWLVALMVWLLPVSEAARFWTIVVITYVIAVGDLTHVIAGSGETLYLVAAGELSFGDYLVGYMAPTLVGNTIGGVVLVALLNHAQVKTG